ncbi:uncharacterized protein LOC127618573 [Xyrauchen texanus]|uniref:uncharacterized protein LOC127618573 n=1 Tax=Xyrauchen texanus TaxID=154827 RepID=UPI002241CB8D|nr:uncharacterized protein LOC127618573 [Xyrauchen texanus]
MESSPLDKVIQSLASMHQAQQQALLELHQEQDQCFQDILRALVEDRQALWSLLHQGEGPSMTPDPATSMASVTLLKMGLPEGTVCPVPSPGVAEGSGPAGGGPYGGVPNRGGALSLSLLPLCFLPSLSTPLSLSPLSRPCSSTRRHGNPPQKPAPRLHWFIPFLATSGSKQSPPQADVPAPTRVSVTKKDTGSWILQTQV